MKLIGPTQRTDNPAAAGEQGPAPEVPAEIKAAIDRIATFIAQYEEDFFGEPFSVRTRVAQDACALVAWAFKGDPHAKLHFYSLLQNRNVAEPEELDRGLF